MNQPVIIQQPQVTQQQSQQQTHQQQAQVISVKGGGSGQIVQVRKIRIHYLLTRVGMSRIYFQFSAAKYLV